MTVLNRTPFPALAFRQISPAGELVGVAVVRGTFRVVPDGPLELAPEQMPLQLADTYAGDPLSSALIIPGDLAPYRPATDVTVLGSAHAPGGRPLPRWSCGVRVGPVSARLAVTGPREWRASGGTWLRRRRVWSLTDPAPVVEVPLDWALAWGGPLPSASGPPDVVTSNPLGRGARPDLQPPEVDRLPAPQIEGEDEPIGDPARDYAPRGFAPVPPFWSVRQRFAGTYDDDWLSRRHPLLPRDFDLRFWCASPPELRARPFLAGDEPFALDGLLPDRPRLAGRLPGLSLELRLEAGGHRGRALFVLDGVQFDLRSGPGFAYLTWRTTFPWPDLDGLPEVGLSSQFQGASA